MIQKYVLSAFKVPGTYLGTGDISTNLIDKIPPMCILVRTAYSGAVFLGENNTSLKLPLRIP